MNEENYVYPIGSQLEMAFGWDPVYFETIFHLYASKEPYTYLDATTFMPFIGRAMSFTGQTVTLMRVKPLGSWPIHVDDRTACINFPCWSYGSIESTTTWWSTASIDLTIDEDQKHRIYDEDAMTSLFSYSMQSPCLFNTKIPHSVKNNSKAERHVISWSVSRNFTYEQARDILKEINNELNKTTELERHNSLPRSS